MQIVPVKFAIASVSKAHHFTRAAVFIENLENLSSRLNIPLEKRNVEAEGGPSLLFAMKLETGRFAVVNQLLTQFNEPLNKAEVLLESNPRRHTAYRADLDEVAAVIGIAVKDFYYVAPNKAVLFWK